MHALTESEIRGSFVNASVRERKSLVLPPGFKELNWERMDFVGWRDPKQPMVGYVVIPTDDDPVGIMLRLGGRQPRKRPLCSFCEDVLLPNDVAFFSAKLAGAPRPQWRHRRHPDLLELRVLEERPDEAAAGLRWPRPGSRSAAADRVVANTPRRLRRARGRHVEIDDALSVSA